MQEKRLLNTVPVHASPIQKSQYREWNFHKKGSSYLPHMDLNKVTKGLNIF